MNFPRTARGVRSFTLIEVLLAAALLAVFTLLLTRMFDAMQITSNFWGKRIDAETQARLVLDRLGEDLAKAVIRPDVDVAFARSAGNDRMRFFSQVEGHPAPAASEPCRGLSLVEYRTNERGQLERGARSLQFRELVFAPLDREESPEFPVALVDGPNNTVPQLDNSFFDLLGDQILRFEIGFLIAGDQPGQSPRLVASLPAGAKTHDLLALVVAIVTLDSKSRTLLTQENLETIAAAFPDYNEIHANAGRDILSVWSETIRNGDLLLLPNIPKTPAQSVRIFQRYYPIR